MVKEGRLRAEDAERHPQRSVITRALGIDSNVKVDFHTLDLGPGDRILLCSDGLSSMLYASTIQRALSETPDPDAAAAELIRLANEAGGEDNITVIVVDVTDTSGGAPVAAGKPIVREPVRTDPEVDAPARMSRPPRRWVKKLIAWVVAVAVLAAGGFFLVDYLLSRSWFVGANEDGFVVVYQGIPEDIMGLDLKDEQDTTALSIDDLPDYLREDVQSGIKVDSEDAAESKVADLRARARALENSAENKRQREQNKKKSN
jgi:protein phosphatase